VTAEEGEDAAGSGVSAVHPLRLQLQTKLRRPVDDHLGQGRPRFKWRRAESMRLRRHVDVKPVVGTRLADLHRETIDRDIHWVINVVAATMNSASR